jgi:hypothetical protein
MLVLCLTVLLILIPTSRYMALKRKMVVLCYFLWFFILWASVLTILSLDMLVQDGVCGTHTTATLFILQGPTLYGCMIYQVWVATQKIKDLMRNPFVLSMRSCILLLIYQGYLYINEHQLTHLFNIYPHFMNVAACLHVALLCPTSLHRISHKYKVCINCNGPARGIQLYSNNDLIVSDYSYFARRWFMVTVLC